MCQLKTPVVLTIFNRADVVERVFRVIQMVKPSQLLVIADGPRTDKVGEDLKCSMARAIIEQVDWKCEVLKNYSEVNLGPRNRIASGLDWVFQTVDSAIILEHDCLPHPSLFDFCQDLLEKYRDDERVMSISTMSVPSRFRQFNNHSYHFSRYFRCWGWATWKRAWQHYDVDIKCWTEMRDTDLLRSILLTDCAVDSWKSIFDATYQKQINTWDYQWVLAHWLNSGLTILPTQNLCSNIGFGVEAFHTTDASSPYANLPLEDLHFPLKHPSFVIPDTRADAYIQQARHSMSKFLFLKKKLRKIVSRSN